MKRWQIILGIVLIALGVLSILDIWLEINIWGVIFALFLIGWGLLLLLRPRMVKPGVDLKMAFIKDEHKAGEWKVSPQEILCFIGSHRLDFTQAEIPNGIAHLKVTAFVEDLKIIYPEDLGVNIKSSAMYSEFKSPMGRKDQLFGQAEYVTKNFENSKKQVYIQLNTFVSDVVIKQALI